MEVRKGTWGSLRWSSFMSEQISNVVTVCNFHIQNIGKVRKYLTMEASRCRIDKRLVGLMSKIHVWILLNVIFNNVVQYA